jgi:hypothetical protein
MEEAALRKLIRATLGLAFVAAFSLANTTNAAPILDFSQSTPGNVVVSTGTNLSTNNTQVLVGALAGVPAPPNTLFTETFSFSSTAAPTGSPGNQTQGGYSGMFTYTNLLTGVIQVQGTVSGAVLSTFTTPGGTGTTASFNSSNVTFTNVAAPILQQAFGTSAIPLNTLTGTFSLTLNNLDPQTSPTLAFNARAAGIITAQVIPEPTSVVMASMACVAGLGGLGLRRIKASRA